MLGEASEERVWQVAHTDCPFCQRNQGEDWTVVPSLNLKNSDPKSLIRIVLHEPNSMVIDFMFRILGAGEASCVRIQPVVQPRQWKRVKLVQLRFSEDVPPGTRVFFFRESGRGLEKSSTRLRSAHFAVRFVH